MGYIAWAHAMRTSLAVGCGRLAMSKQRLSEGMVKPHLSSTFVG